MKTFKLAYMNMFYFSFHRKKLKIKAGSRFGDLIPNLIE